MSYTLEKNLRIHDNKEGVFISVKSYEDYPDRITITTNERTACKEWYGDCDISVSKEEAKLLAQALLELAGE